MPTARYIDNETLMPWLLSLTDTQQVLAPVRSGGQTLFAPLEEDSTLDLDGLADAPPKAALLPRCETLLRFHYSKNGDTPPRTGLEVQEVLPDRSMFIFGARPCDARGFMVFDRVYDAGSRRDIYYCTRRDTTLVGVLACSDPAATCFCDRVGGGPGDSSGADILFTHIGNGYVAEGITERGEAFLENQSLEDAGERVDTARAAREDACRKMPGGESFEGVRSEIFQLFDDADFWESVSAKCLSCGACSYLCPTCYCFNMTDEINGNDGVRVRTWDNCMSFQFTLEGSGHNPRNEKAQRMRNRISHKFSYYPELYGDNLACAGCGRCIAHCPVSMDVREIVTRARSRALAKEEHVNE